MNKKILYGLCHILLLALWSGCAQEPLSTGGTQEEGDVTVRFTASIPGYKTVNTRDDASVSGMWLLVFDENGNFITRREASLSNQTPSGGTFTVSLPASGRPRTIHFIANYDWSSFDDNAMRGASEAEVVATMSVNYPVFWAQVKLTSGISENSFGDTNSVSLLRNRAKISVASNATGFELKGFTVDNRPDKGTVARFNMATGEFAEGTITEPQGMNVVKAEEKDISMESVYLFERKNPSTDKYTAVIVKGKFGADSYYYKIDLIDKDKIRYNIERNYHYMVTILSVKKAGYSSFDEALKGASHNNTVLDPKIEKYPIISDGTAKLEVEKTLVVLTQPGQTFQVWAKYYPDRNDPAVDNSGVTVSLQPGNTALNGASLNFDQTMGVITATALSTTTGEAKITVTKGDLARVIRVVLRQPYSFDDITINNDNPGIIYNGQKGDAVLNFNIPGNFPDELFPHVVKIQAQGLYPASSGLELNVEQGKMYYTYRVTGTGQQTVLFKANQPNYAETVTLKADYFSDGAVNYKPDIYRFTGTILYGNNVQNVPDNATVTVTGVNGASMNVNSIGRYTLRLPATTSESTSITFRYNRGFYTYTQTKTLVELRNDSNLRLR